MPSIRNLILLICRYYFQQWHLSVTARLLFSMTAAIDPRPDDATSADFKTNLNSLLSALEEKAPDNHGFYAAAAGKNNPDKLYGLVQCRGDVSAPDCASCVKDSVRWAASRCNNSNEAAVWLDRCYLRYSDGDFLGQWNGSRAALTPTNAADGPLVAAIGRNYMRLLAADVPNQPYLFQAGSVDVAVMGKRYGLVQCNRDLSMADCRVCTATLLEFYFAGGDRNPSSYRLLSYGCRAWYDTYKFYSDYALPSDPGNDPPLIPTDSSMQLQISFTAAIIMLFSVNIGLHNS